MLLGMMNPVEKAEASGAAFFGEFFTEMLMETAVETIERGIVFGLEEASSDDTELLNLLISFMHSPEENKLEELLKLCEEILEKVEVIDEKIDKIAAQNQEIIEKLDKQSLDKYNDQLVAFNDKYKNIYDQYMDVIEAAKAYAQDPESSSKKPAVVTAYSKLEMFYEQCETGTIDLTGDIQNYAQTISPYAASSTLKEKKDWGTPNASKSTYLSTYLECVKDTSVTQEQIHDNMEYALNSAVAPFYYYQVCVGVYNAMKLQEINADKGLDPEGRQSSLSKAWSYRSDLTNYGINAVNQAADDCYDILTGYRWKIDEDPAVVDMKYYTSYNDGNVYDDADPVKTSETMELSFMTTMSGVTYGVRTDGGINPSVNMADLAYEKYGGSYQYLTLDYMNLRYLKAKEDNFQQKYPFELVSSPADLSGFTNQGSYNSVEGNLVEYLRETGQNPYILGGISNSYAGITKTWHGANISHNPRIEVYNLKNLTSASMEVKNFDTETLLENDKTEVAFLYKERTNVTETEPLIRSCEILHEKGGTAKLCKKGEQEALPAEKDGIYQVNPGVSYSLKIKPDKGYKAAKAVLYRYRTGSEGQQEKEEIRTYDLSSMKRVQKPDEDGFYTVTTYASPYRDVRWEISYEEENDAAHLVTLNQPESIRQGTMQFAGVPGIDRMTYDAGDEVVVYVRGETPYISDGITVRMSDNGTVNVREADRSQMALASGSNTTGYVFTMPDSDVTVSTKLVKGQSVTINASDHGTLEFTDEYGNILGKGNRTKTGISGSQIYMTAVPDDSYHLADVTIQRADNREKVTYTEKNGIIAVTVPEDTGLIAAASFHSSSGVQRTVTIKTTGNGTADFDLQKPTELSSHDFWPGRTVNVFVKPDKGGGVKSVEVTKKGAPESRVPNVSVEPYPDNTEYKMISFVMQAYDVDVNVRFDSVARTTISVDDEAMADLYMKSHQDYEYVASSAINGTKELLLKAGTYRLKINPADSDSKVLLSRNGGTGVNMPCREENGELVCDFDIEETDQTVKIDVNADTQTHYIADYDEWCRYRDLMNGENGAKWQGDTYILLNDIDCGGKQIGQIKRFSGTLDGKGHTIKSNPDNSDRTGGLIGYLDGGNVKNLNLKDFHVDGDRATAGFLADSASARKMLGESDCQIDHCSISADCQAGTAGTEEVTDTAAGGLIGTVKAGSAQDEFRIYNCEVYGRISGYSERVTTGGLIGSISNGAKVHIYNSHFSGTLDAGTGNWVCKKVGGIVGYTEGTSTWVDNCHMDMDFSVFPYNRINENSAWVSRILNGNGGTVQITDTYALGAVMDQSQGTMFPLTYGGYSEGGSEVQDKGDLTREPFQNGEITKNLNQRAEASARSGFSLKWKQDTDRPVLTDAKIDPVALYTAAITPNGSGSASFAPIPENGSTVQSVKQPEGHIVTCYIKPADKNLSTPAITVDRNGTVYCKAAAAYNEATGCYEASFVMPAGDVKVRYSFESIDYTIAAKVVPAEAGNAKIVNEAGEEITTAGLYDTVYLALSTREGYSPDGIYLYSGSSGAFYSQITDLAPNEKGLYPFKINGGDGPEKEKLITAKVNIAEGVYQIKETHSGSGKVDIGVDGGISGEAKMGNTVKVSAKPSDGYFCSAIELVDTATGDKIKELWLETDGSGASIGEFAMPGKNITVNTVFSSRMYNIQVEKDDKVTLDVLDGQGNNISMARTGETVTVRWDLDKAMFKTLKVEKKDGGFFSNKLVKELDTSKEEDTFTMSADDVVITAVTDDKDYKLIRDTEGNGYVMLNDLTTHDKETGKAGQTIFAALYPKEGWSLMEDSKVIDKDGNVLAVLDAAKQYAVFTMPQSDITITGGFVAEEYGVAAKTEGDDQAALPQILRDGKPTTKANCGDTLIVKADTSTGKKLGSISYTCTTKSGKTTTADLEVKDGTAVFTMPAGDVTVTAAYTDYAFDTDEQGRYLVSDFDDLKAVARAVQEEPDVYARATFRVTSPIHGNGGKWDLPIGTAETPFNGTFIGAGYYLMDYTIDTDQDNMALFGVIGETGTVTQMGAIYGRIKSTGNQVAELAAVNYGVVNGCYSGSNLTGGTIMTKNGLLSLNELNTEITGTKNAAGLVAENHGTIINSRSHSNVTGKEAAGVALYNYGVVENAYNYGTVTGTDRAGGVVGTNEDGASVYNVYNSGQVHGAKAGAVAAMNHGTISDKAYYGDGQPNEAGVGTAKALSDMSTNTFRDLLNENLADAKNADGLYSWVRDSSKNSGYPRISSPMVVSQTLNSEVTRIRVEGTIHAETYLKASALDQNSEAYRAFESYAAGLKIVRAVDPSLIYRNGDFAEYEGKLTLSLNDFKGSMKSVKLLKYEDGKVREVKFKKTGNSYVLEIDHLVPMAVAADPSSVSGRDPAQQGSDITKGEIEGLDQSGHAGHSSRTGDRMPLYLLLILMAGSAAAAVTVLARRKSGKK